MAALVIRPARDADARSIAEIHVRAWQWAYRGLLPTPFLDRLSIERRAAFWAGWLADASPQRHLWVASRPERLVGFAATGPSRDPDADAMTAELHAIYLEPAVVGTGLGRALCGHAVQHLAHEGFREATLWVMTANDRARRFYERGGWRPDGAEKTTEWAGVPISEVRYRCPVGPEPPAP